MRKQAINVWLLFVAVAGYGVTEAFASQIGTYDFTINRMQSGLAAAVSADVSTDGTLIGNYDEKTNPTGTRTKPGLFGPFGATENLPVQTRLGVGMDGTINTRTDGGFRLVIDRKSNSLSMSGFEADFLSGSGVNLPITITLQTETFRTRNPTFLYPGVPIELPLGEATLSRFDVVQVGDAAPGVITPDGTGAFGFTIVPLVQLNLTISVLGNEFVVPGVPTPFPLAGTLRVMGDNATIDAMQPIELTQSAMPGVMIPQFPLALPTLNPDQPANVLLDLTLQEVQASIIGTLNLRADGVLIPAPGACLALAGLLAFTGRRGTARPR